MSYDIIPCMSVKNNIFEQRKESASIRMMNNAKIKTLSPAQHEIIAETCKMRHELHCSDDELYNGESLFCGEATNWIDNINLRLKKLKLSIIEYMPRIEEYPSAEDKYCGLITEDEEEENKEKFYVMMIKLNSSIEEWLTKIDNEFLTNYAPTGTQRKVLL